MSLPPPQALDRSKLHLFVAGPGRGEGLAIALPNMGWIFIDGCRAARGAYPLQQIWETYRSEHDRVEGILLTHPHQDHYQGMTRLISAVAPRWLACVATHHPDGGVLRAEALARRDDPLVDDHQNLLSRRVRDLLKRFQTEWNLGRSKQVLLRADELLPLDRTDVSIEVVAPDSKGVKEFFETPDLPDRIRERANELSAVLHVRFGSSRLVLGADLPERDHGAGQRTGWSMVLKTYPDLPGSLVLKVPHHGSDGAMHPRVVGPGAACPGAVWTLTPFRGSKRPDEDPLPHLSQRRGVGALLRGVPHVYLTSLPSGWISRASLDEPVPLGAIRREQALLDIPGAISVERARVSPCGPLEAIWLFAVDDAGRCVGEHRGPRALKIARAAGHEKLGASLKEASYTER